MTRAVTVARVAAGLLAASSLLGGPAEAQAPTTPSLAGVQGRAEASGVAVAYQPEGLLPIASPIDLSSPDALATIASGPSTFARASTADPGDLLANPDAMLALASTDYEAGTVPPYPYRVSASSGTGEPSAESNPAPGLNARVFADGGGSNAQATMPFLAAPAVATAGSISSIASTTTDGATVTVHARSEVTNFDLLGILTIDSIVSDVTATSDGTDTSVAGGTTITGASVLDQPVTIDADGVHGDAPSGPSGSLLGDVLGPDGGGAGEALTAAGISVTLLGPVAQDGETSGQLSAAGLRIVLEVSEDTMPILGQLADVIPPSDVPGVEDAVALTQVRHLQYIDIGRGFVSLTARARPDRASASVTPTGSGSTTGGSASAGALVGATTPARTATPPAAGGGGAAVPAGATPGPTTSLAAGIGALAVLALLAQPFAGNRLARLATGLLAPGATGYCAREER